MSTELCVLVFLPSWFEVFKLDKTANCFQLLSRLTQVSAISYLQGIPQIVSWFSSWFGMAPQGLNNQHLKPFQFWVGSKFLFVVLLEHYCPNLRSQALWIRFSFITALYLAPCFLPCYLQVFQSLLLTVNSSWGGRSWMESCICCMWNSALCIKVCGFIDESLACNSLHAFALTLQAL